jgi:TolB-like protein/DNA-binding winged helix-turn-helix (wHTH) protein
MKGRIYRFAEFELITSEGELRTSNSSTRLQEKPLRLLSALLDRPQCLVTREELRERLWDSETFVDFEQGINVAIKKVRDALGDSAQNPRFIETVAKRGYRFLIPADVSFLDGGPSLSVPEPAVIDLPLALVPDTRQSVRPRWVIAGVAAGVLVAVGIWLFVAKIKPHHSAQIQSIAVLPLQNLSPDSGQEYLADGITEELLTNLAQSLPLRVISRTSVMRYKQTNEPIKQIAQQLGVEAIVEGSVARSGNHVTVTVQLIDATEDRHLWAQKYERDLGDLMGMEAELSREIASQVGGALNSHRPPGATTGRPVDPQVYDLCLMGRYFWNQRTAAGLSKSIELFQQAIDRDPAYAPAYAGLADAYVISPFYNSVDLDSSFTSAVAAARHAIELDDTLAGAHATLGMVALQNWSTESTQANREFQRALALNPNYATAHQWFSFYFVFSRQMDEALAELELARQLDPLSSVINADEGHLLYAMDRYSEAETRLRQAIELSPDLGQPHETLALIDLAEGRSSDAVSEARRGLALDIHNPRTMGEA